MDEVQILEELRSRNMAAFERLYDSLSSLVMYYAEQITKDEREAEDITVYSFSRFWQQDLSEYNSMKKVKNFIFNVARNAAIDFLRKKKVRDTYQENVIYLTDEQEEYEIEKSRYETEMLRKVFEEIDKLPKRTKEAFKMVYIDELTSREVGNALNISPVTVRRLCSEALQKLKNKFSERDFQLVLFLLSLIGLDKTYPLLSFSLYQANLFF
jgi:RNA polymerase sigma factor (sigma-70 family)